MEYRRFGDTYVVRLDIGDEIAASLLFLAEREDIRLAEVTGIGALRSFTVGAYDVGEQKYHANDFEGTWEICSLLGTLSRMGGKPYQHLHLTAGDTTGRVAGGHLTRAVIGATGEIVVRLIDGEVDRVRDGVTGLNIFRFL